MLNNLLHVKTGQNNIWLLAVCLNSTTIGVIKIFSYGHCRLLVGQEKAFCVIV